MGLILAAQIFHLGVGGSRGSRNVSGDIKLGVGRSWRENTSAKKIHFVSRLA